MHIKNSSNCFKYEKYMNLLVHFGYSKDRKYNGAEKD